MKGQQGKLYVMAAFLMSIVFRFVGAPGTGR